MRMRVSRLSLSVGFAIVVATASIACQPAPPQNNGANAAAVRQMPRTTDGKPDFTGIWQANNEAYWDLQAHPARAGMVTQPGVFPYEYAQVAAAPVVALGAAAGVPASLGVVQGDGEIPYKPEAATIRKANSEHWIDRDPELKCYLPGTPRAMYMPYPFQVVQGDKQMQMAFSFSNASRTIHFSKVTGPPVDTYMGHSVAHWDGDTLVVDVTDFNGKNWLDRAGNFHSEKLHLTERYTLQTPDVIHYEATIDDPETYTRPWTIAMPIYRRMEANAQVLEYRCVEFAEEFLFGNLRKAPLVKHWEGETMSVDITRKVPPGDQLYEWYRR